MRTRHAALGILISCAACGISVVGVDPTDGGVSTSPDAAVLTEGGGAVDDSGSPIGNEDGAVPASGPVTIASAGTVAAPTGNAQQTHLVYAENGKRWWLFTITSDAPSSLQAWSSPDFRTWTAAPELALPRPHQGQGANFSVAYASLAAHDVVHLGIGLVSGSDHTHYHARASLDGGAIVWSALTGISTVNDSELSEPEGAVTAIRPSGSVTDFTGWAAYGGSGLQTGNEDAFTSLSNDDGVSPWTSGFGGRTDIAAVSKLIHARAVLSLGGETLFTFWESADAEPDPSSVRSSRNGDDGWSSSSAVFADKKLDVNDWGVAALGATDVHAVRRTGGFEHRRWDGAGWKDGDKIPALDGVKKGSGVVVLHGASRVLLAAIAGDGSVQMTSWSGGAWSAWSAVAPAAAAGRSSLSGWWSPSAGTGLVWTESAHVAGVRVP